MKKYTKSFLAIIATAFMFSFIAPSFVSIAKASELDENFVTEEISGSPEVAIINEEDTELSQEELDLIVSDILQEVEETKPVIVDNNKMTTFGVVSIGTKLIKVFGKSYVKEKLPKIIYKKFPAKAKEKMSEAAWVGGWNTYILMGPLDEAHDVVTDFLDKYMWHWLASSCGYIVQAAIYALI